MDINRFGGREAIFITWRRGRQGAAISDFLPLFVILDVNVVTAHTKNKILREYTSMLAVVPDLSTHR